MSRDPVLIFAGGKGVGKRTLAGRMLGERSHPLPTVVAASPDLWQLQTKYFEAKIVAKVVAEPSSLEAQGIESCLCEAVVLVFDMSDDDSFSVLKAWEGFLSSVDPSIALCVANKADRCSTDAGKLDGKRDVWLEWCLDNGLEFIECSALCDQVSGDSRDTEGVERVIEAIGSHTWSGMHVKEGSSNSAGSGKIEAQMEALSTSNSGRNLDYRKWDSLRCEEEQEDVDAKVQPERIGSLVPKAAVVEEVDEEELWRWMGQHGPTDEEIELLEELKDIASRQGFLAENFFMDSSALSGSSQPAFGPNVAVHLNQAHMLPRIAQVLKIVGQHLEQHKEMSRLAVRLRLWTDIVDKSAEGATAILPLVIIWCILESCAAETSREFLKRVTLNKETLSEWSESAIVPAFLRSSDTQSRRSDYVRNVISSAEELKARGNNEFKATRYHQAIGEYQVAIHMLEQFYQDGRHLLPKGKDIILSCHLNIAACSLKIPNGHDAASRHCTYALHLDVENPKAYFRRGVAFFQTPQKTDDVQHEKSAQQVPQFSNQEDNQDVPPPREVLLAWAIRGVPGHCAYTRDLERANELTPGDSLVEDFLAKARAEAKAAAKSLEPLAPEHETESSDDKEDTKFDEVLSMFKNARNEAQSLPDDARRQRAAEVASRAAALFGLDEEESPGGCDSDS